VAFDEPGRLSTGFHLRLFRILVFEAKFSLSSATDRSFNSPWKPLGAIERDAQFGAVVDSLCEICPKNPTSLVYFRSRLRQILTI
jgi:hypothetical protein